MKKDYRILILGNLYSAHICRFTRNLKLANPNVIIDGFDRKREDITFHEQDYATYNNIELASFTTHFTKYPLLRSIEIVHNWRRMFRQFSKGKHYDIVNIHFPEYVIKYIIGDIREIADKIVITPWGSDVYRIDNRQKKLLQVIYDKSDYVVVSGRFADDCKRKFSIPNNKILEGRMGSETIDYILEHKNDISKDQAKNILNLSNTFLISCGYNASTAQNHLQIIDAISQVKDSLPSNMVLLFPVTYPRNSDYINLLKSTLNDKGLKGVFFEEYLDLESLFILRQATDMFIHVQTTDANNASLKEYLLLGKNCVNAKWLKYPDVEDNQYKPYYLVDNLENLGRIILQAYRDGQIPLSERAYNNIVKLSSKTAAQQMNKLFQSIVA